MIEYAGASTAGRLAVHYRGRVARQLQRLACGPARHHSWYCDMLGTSFAITTPTCARSPISRALRVVTSLCGLSSGACAVLRRPHSPRTCAMEATPPAWKCASATTSTSSIAAPDSAFWASTAARIRRTSPFSAHVFVSHFHWDHIQGMPFFRPLYDNPENRFLFHCSSRTPQPEAGNGRADGRSVLPRETSSQMQAHRNFYDIEEGRITIGRRRQIADHVAQPSPGLHGIPPGNQRRHRGLRHRQRARRCPLRQERAQAGRRRRHADLRRAVSAGGIRGAPPRLGTQPLARSRQRGHGKRRERTWCSSTTIPTTPMPASTKWCRKRAITIPRCGQRLRGWKYNCRA